jgi:hypothetical protein
MKAFRSVAAIIALACAVTAHAQSTQRGFSVVLLLGETQNASGGDGLPPAPGVRKALADVKDFLPYRSYRVLDTQWTRSGTSHMRGLDDQEYDLEIAADELMPTPFNPKPGTLHVVFKLQEPGAAVMPGEAYARSMQAADFERKLLDVRARLATTQSDEAKKRVADEAARLEGLIRAARARKLIDSTFNMQSGETVVVGTSKIGGDKGLVVLLTSVTAGGK